MIFLPKRRSLSDCTLSINLYHMHLKVKVHLKLSRRLSRNWLLEKNYQKVKNKFVCVWKHWKQICFCRLMRFWALIWENWIEIMDSCLICRIRWIKETGDYSKVLSNYTSSVLNVLVTQRMSGVVVTSNAFQNKSNQTSKIISNLSNLLQNLSLVVLKTTKFVQL